MIRTRLLRASLAGLLGFVGLAGLAAGESAPAPADPLFEALEPEFSRIWDDLRARAEPVHWMAVQVTDRETVSVDATHGAAGSVVVDQQRLADLDLRVGTPERDSTHKIRDESWFSEEPRPELVLPLEDRPAYALRSPLWQTADDAYRAAVRRLAKVRTNESVKVASEDQSADFSSAPAVVDLRSGAPLQIQTQGWRDRVRATSSILLDYPEVFDSNVSLNATSDRTSFLSSEGTRLRSFTERVRVAVWAGSVAEDGMELRVYDYVEAASPDRLPDQEALEVMANGVGQMVTALRHAPLVEPFAGPAILRGRAAAVFFHEILGHRLEGQRQKDEDEGQTFTDKVGELILPSFLSVHDDPTLDRWGDQDLSGHYAYDDEGVAAERATLVDHGVLRGFLMSRSPVEGFLRSNGHGRRQSGAAPVARQGNLIVTASQTVPYATLRQRLVDEIKRQGKPFGLIFDDISGGFTFTGRSTPQAFNVSPVVVWRVYPDGRPDELVRGADLIGTPLVAFSRILAASDQMDVFNGVCGAESGWVPVSAVAPDLLLSEVEVQRREKGNDRPPVLSPPGAPSQDAASLWGRR